jgi:uncharacterized protein YdeI (YjbR/CyaY-like superfamily)
VPTKDPRFDAYIETSAPFARPILRYVRAVVHAACPDVVETMKWSSPSFEYHGILCGMAAFKAHCAFGFWKHELVLAQVDAKSREAMGSFGRITSLDDLPSKTVLTRYIAKAMKLNEDGVKVERAKTVPKKPLRAPPELSAALARNAKARAAFAAFPPSHKREYVEWIAEAKGADTRARRVAQAIEWMAAGKPRNWKHMKR